MTRRLNLFSIAEGIDTDEDLQMLHDLVAILVKAIAAISRWSQVDS